jgi:hypothetical protein
MIGYTSNDLQLAIRKYEEAMDLKYGIRPGLLAEMNEHNRKWEEATKDCTACQLAREGALLRL